MKKMMIYALIIIVLVLLVLFALGFRQVQIYKQADSNFWKEGTEQKLMQQYEKILAKWTVPYNEFDVESKFGRIHVIECGNKEGKDLVLFHAASVGSVSWIENVTAFYNDYHIYAVDVLGDNNKSTLHDVNVFPNDPKSVAETYMKLFREIGIQNPNVIGASYGGFVTLLIAREYPNYFDKVVLSGPMGISESVGNVIFVLTAYTFFPYDFFAKPITKWSVGEPETEVMTDLTDYFSIVIKGALGRYYRPRTLDKEYLNAIEDDVLLILGSKDKLVGDTNKASEYASSIKNIKVKILESGHLINSEKSSDFNETVLGYFSE